MKVKDLITLLSKCNMDDTVYVSYKTNDYWGSILVEDVKCISSVLVKESDYYQGKMKVVDCEDEDTKTLLVIK